MLFGHSAPYPPGYVKQKNEEVDKANLKKNIDFSGSAHMAKISQEGVLPDEGPMLSSLLVEPCFY